MDDLIKNFTPIDLDKKRNKKNIKKIVLIVSLFMMFFVVGITSYYLRLRLLSSSSKAIGRAKREGNTPRVSAKRQWEKAVRDAYLKEYGKYSDFNIANIGTKEYLSKYPPPKCTAGRDVGCVKGGIGGVPQDHYSVCANGSANAYCNDENNGKDREIIAYSDSAPTIPPEVTPTTLSDTPIPTNTLAPTPSDTPIPTNTSTPTPTTPPNQPTNTPVPTNTLTPTEIIVVRVTNTPIISSPTNTPIQQIVETGDIRSSWVFAVPVGIILLGLLL